MPETPREDPIEIIMNIANGIGVSLQASDIDVAHRIGRSERTARGVKTRDLCVKFRTYQNAPRCGRRAKLSEAGSSLELE